MGFGLETGFIYHFNIQLVTTFNYSAIADFHSLQITTAHTKSFQSAVFSSCSLATASNNRDSSTAPIKFTLHRLPYNFLPTHSVTTEYLLNLSQPRTCRKYHSLLYLSRFCGNMPFCEGVTQKWLCIPAY
jgi:hypothetical protein